MRRIITANARYWLERLEKSGTAALTSADVLNVAAALAAAVEAPEAWPLVVLLVLALHPHMERQGHWNEWDDLMQFLANEARRQADQAAEACFLMKRGAIQRQRGDHRAAMLSYRRAWRLCLRMADRSGMAWALSNLGDLHRLEGSLQRAEILCAGALALLETLEEPARAGRTENHLGLICLDRGFCTEALSHFVRAKTLLEQACDEDGLARVWHNLGVLYQRTDELESALDCFRQAVRRYRQMGDGVCVARVRINMGNIYLDRNDLTRAEKVYSKAEAVLKRAGESVDLATTRNNLGIVYTRQNRCAEAKACFDRALEQWRSQEDVWNLANTLGEVAELHLACGRRSKARAFLDEALKLVEGRTEPRYESLRTELIERQARLGFK